MHIGARTNAFFCLVPAVKIFLPLIEGLFSAPDAEDPVTRSFWVIQPAGITISGPITSNNSGYSSMETTS